MSKLITRKPSAANQLEEPPPKLILQNRGDFNVVISTGSTLLDLAISGGRIRGGGIPGGIILEIFGPSGSGKTSILSEICADAQLRGGEVKFLDPEARLDREYTRIYGVDLDKTNYERPETVKEVFDFIFNWKPKESPAGTTNVVATDSLAALSSELELSEAGDKYGMRIAKDFNQGLRKTCVLIRRNNWIIANTNQIRSGTSGEVTPGGKGIPFFSSLRIRIGPPPQNMYVKKEVTMHGKKHEKTIGIKSVCIVKKSTVDDPYRQADIYIVFGYGIDDIRANLQFCKQVGGETTYDAITKSFQPMQGAIRHIEKEGLVKDLKEKTIDLWEELHDKFRERRSPKERG